jgi:hypothetical protein
MVTETDAGWFVRKPPAHEAPQAVHDHIAADHARRRALELHAELDTLNVLDLDECLTWMGKADVILKELARA